MKASRIILAIIATILIYWMCFALFGCSEPVVVPECRMATIEYKDKWCVTINSESPSVVMCRDLGKRTECWTIVAHYYSCIRIEAEVGEIITFDDNGAICSLVVR
jgi:hypothetical protein